MNKNVLISKIPIELTFIFIFIFKRYDIIIYGHLSALHYGNKNVKPRI